MIQITPLSYEEVPYFHFLPVLLKYCSGFGLLTYGEHISLILFFEKLISIDLIVHLKSVFGGEVL